MKIISLNANGIRAAARKGLFDWLSQQDANVLCLQETKAKEAQLHDQLFHPLDYYCYFSDAEKPGYSGTAIYTKYEPKHIKKQLGWKTADREGRYLQVDFEQLSIVSIYLPSGSSGEARQAIKFEFMAVYEQLLQKLKRQKRQYIICGDWNIVHKEIDIKNFKANQKNSGCLPEERDWLDKLLQPGQFVDAFRVVDQRPEQYTWWSNRGRAWEKNVGWRIDYQIITSKLEPAVNNVSIYKDERFSDHAPLIIDYDDKIIQALM
ncbi:MAG: exodeoxyribonuclease III [Pseudomonadota bacterium]